jgi:hypothetical protein
MREYLGFYVLIGLAYYCVNIFIRKLHVKNDNAGAEMLVMVWLLLWPICFIALFAAWISDRVKKREV